MSPLFWLLIGGRCCPSEGYCWWVQGSYGQRTGWGQKGGPPICDVQGPHWQNWQGMLLASLSCFRHWQILKLNCSRSLARMDIRKTRRCWRMSLTLPGPLPVGMSPPFIRYRRTSLRRRMLDALVIIQTIVAFELAFVSLCFRCHVFTRTCFVRRNHFGTKEIIFFYSLFTLYYSFTHFTQLFWTWITHIYSLMLIWEDVDVDFFSSQYYLHSQKLKIHATVDNHVFQLLLLRDDPQDVLIIRYHQIKKLVLSKTMTSWYETSHAQISWTRRLQLKVSIYGSETVDFDIISNETARVPQFVKKIIYIYYKHDCTSMNDTTRSSS